MIIDLIKTGWDHILDLDGIDHMLFIATLCSIYLIRDWKKLLILVTAFTVGHSLTLALSAYRLVKIDGNLIETLIPITIILTALLNIYHSWNENNLRKMSNKVLYLMTLFFGLIHGLGFSNFLRAMLMKSSIMVPLLGFNVGLELGQLLVVTAVLTAASLLVSVFKTGIKMRDWANFISGAAAGIGLILLLNTAFWTKNVLGKKPDAQAMHYKSPTVKVVG